MTIRFTTIEELKAILDAEVFFRFLESVGAFEIEFPIITKSKSVLVVRFIDIPDT